jgi:hypothetical protein
MFNNCFVQRSCHLWDDVEKYYKSWTATDDIMVHVHCMLDTKGYKHTLEYVILNCFFTAAMVAWTTSVLHYMYIACVLISSFQPSKLWVQHTLYLQLGGGMNCDVTESPLKSSCKKSKSKWKDASRSPLGIFAMNYGAFLALIVAIQRKLNFLVTVIRYGVCMKIWLQVYVHFLVHLVWISKKNATDILQRLYVYQHNILSGGILPLLGHWVVASLIIYHLLVYVWDRFSTGITFDPW